MFYLKLFIGLVTSVILGGFIGFKLDAPKIVTAIIGILLQIAIDKYFLGLSF